MSSEQPRAVAWLVDCHVHFHPSFAPDTFLDAAFAAFHAAAHGVPAIGALCMVDAPGQQGFQRLKGSRGDWDTSDTAEETSFLVRRGDHVLAVIAGRQAATAERLEVLQIGSAAELPDGAPMAVTLERARASGGIAVVPWGFGKWTFARRRIVRDLIERDDGALLLGDTGNRPHGLREHAAFRRARMRGIPVLPGSDPLPLASHAVRAGSCGVRLPGAPDLERPTKQLLGLLADRRQPETFGTHSPLIRFVVDQIGIRMGHGVGARAAGTP